MTKNIDDLTNIDQSHPGLREQFETGALSVCRTTKNFCRAPVDLTLEQTINSNAANKLTGISSFTNSLYARQRWPETHTARKAIISHLFEHLMLNESNENCNNDRQNRIFANQVEKFINEVQSNIDPFSEDLNRSKLFNLSTGKAAFDETVEFLLNAHKNGVVQMDNFIIECLEDENRFYKPIKKNIIKNFANSIKRKGGSKESTDEAQYERNILGQILCLAMNNSISIDMVLSFPLTQFPHSLANADGTMIKSSKKNELLSLLMEKNEVEHLPYPGSHDVEIIDGHYVLGVLKDIPTKYGLFSSLFLKILCNTTAREIHIIFDKDKKEPSLRDLNIKTKEMLMDHQPCIKINGPNQERGSSLAKCLLHPEFRDELVKFLIKQWSTSEIKEIIGDKRIFLSFGKDCHLFSKNHALGSKLESFATNHFEVASKMIFHLGKIAAKEILIRSSDCEKLLVY